MHHQRKYLTYTPWPGELNNTRMSFETSLVLAYLSGRCLVMPKEYRRVGEPEVLANKFRPLHPGECFELDTLRGIVTLLSYDEYQDSVLNSQLSNRIDLGFAPGQSVFCFPAIPAPGSPESEGLHDFAATRQNLIELTSQMNACHTLNINEPPLEHFYSFFYCSKPDKATACKRLVKRHVRFRPVILGAAQTIATLLGNYCAIHVRRNDFIQQYPWQNIPADQLLYNLRTRVPRGMRLYIASDEVDRNFFADFRRDYQLHFIEDFRSILPRDLSRELIACVEQMVCAFSQIFVGTKLSTYSGYITRLRGYYGNPDTNIYFTDGSPCMDTDASRFSWEDWVQSGNPLWGREFREAWEF
jgi:hypothetical protein